MTDPRPSWAVPLSWEVTAKALGGRREALIRWGCSPMRSLTGFADFRDPFGRTSSRFGEAVLYRANPHEPTF